MNFYLIAYALSADTPLGRVEKHFLSQQTLMELLIAGFTEKRHRILESIDQVNDVSEWNGVKFSDAQEVENITWVSMDLEGSIDFQWLPNTVKYVYLSWNNLGGTVDLTCLPDGLEALSLAINRFEGSVDLTRLPSRIRELCLHNNRFCGMTDFSQLPKSLTLLTLRDTELEGEIFAFDGRVIVENSNVKDMRKK